MEHHITTEEAKSRQIPGSDVYRYSHLLYHAPLNRDHGVVRLNLEAMKAFSDTVAISERSKLAEEQAAVKEWLAKGGFQANLPYPWGVASAASMEYSNYEHLKIACGLELHLKARLLARNYILHEVDQKSPGYGSIATEQKKRPILKSELFAIQSYRFDGQQNYLPGIRDSSIKFSWLTDNANYRKALGLSDQQLNIIRDYRVLRNQVHFPGDIVDAESIRSYPEPIANFLTKFINTEIVDWSNALIEQYQMNFRPFVRLE